MIACMGFGNLFSSSGLLPPFASVPDANISSVPTLSAISTTSGSSWYSLQLFYSQQVWSLCSVHIVVGGSFAEDLSSTQHTHNILCHYVYLLLYSFMMAQYLFHQMTYATLSTSGGTPVSYFSFHTHL